VRNEQVLEAIGALARCFSGTLTRRQVLAGATGLGLTFPTLSAQPIRSQRPFRLGLFPHSYEPWLTWGRDDFAAHDWQDGIHYVYVNSDAGFGDAVTVDTARALIAQRVDVLTTYSTAHALMLHRVTQTIPIVMYGSGYPVEAGVANSLAHPGKNVTGITTYAGTGIWGKLLQLVRESSPKVERIAVAWGYVPPFFPKAEIEPCYRELRQGAAAIRVALHIQEIANGAEIGAALASISGFQPNALLVMAGPGFFDKRQEVMRYSIANRLPTAADWRWLPQDELQPMITLGASTKGTIRQGNDYVMRILEKGERAGDLPIQQPSKFDLTISRRTAAAIGLELPQALVVRADELIG
jgi:putative tryptophan/tyrosine transport system substrate-binding protein